MRLGSLFSVAGLGDLGWMMAGFEIQWQVEIDKYCQKVLDLRFPESDKYYDIRQFKPKEAKPVDIVAGGFPCQPFSVAGKQEGDQDDRNLWPEMFRIIKEIRQKGGKSRSERKSHASKENGKKGGRPKKVDNKGSDM